LKFIVEHGKLDDNEAYGNLNMGQDTRFCAQLKGWQVLNVAEKFNIKAYNAGVVEEGEKKVIIEPKTSPLQKKVFRYASKLIYHLSMFFFFLTI
jgi:phosphoribosylformylglycinamidine cyclo-ligase